MHRSLRESAGRFDLTPAEKIIERLPVRPFTLGGRKSVKYKGLDPLHRSRTRGQDCRTLHDRLRSQSQDAEDTESQDKLRNLSLCKDFWLIVVEYRT